MNSGSAVCRAIGARAVMVSDYYEELQRHRGSADCSNMDLIGCVC